MENVEHPLVHVSHTLRWPHSRARAGVDALPVETFECAAVGAAEQCFPRVDYVMYDLSSPRKSRIYRFTAAADSGHGGRSAARMITDDR